MDPNACLERLKDAVHDDDFVEAADAAADLRGWVARGGFEPDDPTWREWVARALK